MIVNCHHCDKPLIITPKEPCSKSALALSAGHLGHTLGHGGKVCHGEVPADEMIQESNDFCT